ncbi:MAG TPA: hypothetical protein VK846_14525, partial [Candidatus Limnocylindria bacterium]|nr:hypothetical protein [Candidatus Limnocylindria bacterium]
MKNRNARRRHWIIASLLCAPVLPLLAAEDPALRVKLEEPQPPTKNRFGMSYRAAFNITAKFKNVGNVRTPNGGPGPGDDVSPGQDRTYDDGYNRVDATGNGGGHTWFWAYKNPSQIVGDTVVMHSTTVRGINSKTIDSDPEHGFELTYNRELGRTGKSKNLPWGLEGGLGWTDIDIRDHRRLSGTTSTINDAYNLEGVDPSRNIIEEGGTTPAPFTEGGSPFAPGTFGGPGALAGDAPDRTITSGTAQVRGARHFDANFFSLRVGPYLEIPIDDRWSFSVSAGAAVGWIDGEFSFNQVRTTGSGASR